MSNAVVPVFGFRASVPTETNIYHQAGEFIVNEAPGVGEAFGWVCTVAGRPGTWVAIAALPQAVLYNTTVSVSAAELAALRATPKTLVAAPGAGYALHFVGAQLMLDYTAPAFTETADNLAIKYTDGSGLALSDTIECTGFIDQTADTVTNAVPVKDRIAAKTASENKALVLHNTGDGEFAGSGGSALRVNITYRIVSTGF
jgi:hypothetical protein